MVTFERYLSSATLTSRAATNICGAATNTCRGATGIWSASCHCPWCDASPPKSQRGRAHSDWIFPHADRHMARFEGCDVLAELPVTDVVIAGEEQLQEAGVSADALDFFHAFSCALAADTFSASYAASISEASARSWIIYAVRACDATLFGLFFSVRTSRQLGWRQEWTGVSPGPTGGRGRYARRANRPSLDEQRLRQKCRRLGHDGLGPQGTTGLFRLV